MSKEIALRVITDQIINILVEKNKAYGNSFEVSGDFLTLLYPNGVQPSQYGSMLTLARVFDKMKRIATSKDAFGENPWMDIVGYGLLELSKDYKMPNEMLPKVLSRMEQMIEEAKNKIEKTPESSTETPEITNEKEEVIDLKEFPLE